MIKTKLKDFNYSGFSEEKLKYMLDFDFDINFIVGGRSNYKTSTCQEYAIKQYIKFHKKTIRLVRNLDNSRKEYTELFFTPFVKDKIYKEYGYDIIYESKNYYLVRYDENDEIIFKEDFCRIVPLSKAQSYKSNGLEHYTTIFFDEFAPEDGTPYLKKEIDKLTNFISTVNRNNEKGLKVFLVGNMISADNLYFSFYDIDALDLKVNNIYDYTVEGFQRVGVFVVDPVFDKFEDAPRILRTHKKNIQETSQKGYEIPKDIIDINDIFLFMFTKYHDDFFNRFKVKYIIDVCDLDNHMFYFVVYADKYNDTFLYFGTEQMENSDICITFSGDYFKSRTTHTICNSIINKPVWVTPLSNRVKFLDRNARKLYFDLKNEGKLY